MMYALWETSIDYCCLCLWFRKPFTVQSTICLGESRGWQRGIRFLFLKPILVSGFDVEVTFILEMLMIYYMIGDLYRKQPCLMLGTRCCQFYIWWQCYHYHRLTCYCFQDHHPMMVISPKYQKVGSRNTAKDLVPVIKFIASSWISFWLI